jgi:hypothetical protein
MGGHGASSCCFLEVMIGAWRAMLKSIDSGFVSVQPIATGAAGGWAMANACKYETADAHCIGCR